MHAFFVFRREWIFVGCGSLRIRGKRCLFVCLFVTGEMKYADVILPIPLADSYTYRIPEEMENAVIPGCRVIVHFGSKRYYTAIVMEVHDQAPKVDFEIKDIYALLDTSPVLRRPQLRFWKWISSYYICKLGDVYRAALPAGLKSEGEASRRGFVPKTETFVRLSDGYRDSEKLRIVFEALRRARKQEQLLLAFLDLSHTLNPSLAKELSKKELLEKSGCNASLLNALLKRGVLECYEKEVSRLRIPICRPDTMNPLSLAQEKAYLEICESFRTKDVCLLHGVTSSGKTEIYIRLIHDVLCLKRQVLYLLPEIAITTQITERLARFFGDKLLVYHSRFSDNERVEVWNQLLRTDGPMLILGVRSSLFLPFKDLGLVIVDEEHENTYKQQDPAPRYHARNAAIVLANMHGGKTLLGSATPSIDSYYNAMTGKYGYVELSVRYGDCRMPEVLTVDVKELRRKRIMKDTLFSPLLVERMQEALSRDEQVILFQNRRGFAPLIECRNCGWVPRCVNCDVSLTYHKAYNQLGCHYCGYTYRLPEVCPECQGTEFRMSGFGTEKVEEEISLLFPGVKVGRLDLDVARTRTAYERILSDFERGKTRILIGTQMISKGLDFANVSVVGILSADSLMNYPDFRAHERAYQLMAQVSGRAGRRDKQGTVILQTTQPSHPLMWMVRESAYKEMAQTQLSERATFHYPPYYRLIVLVLRGKDLGEVQEMSSLYADKLRLFLAERVLGPVTPPITRIQALHIKKIVLKIEITAGVASLRNILEKVYMEMMRYEAFKHLRVHYDVDPV